jgi:hypothetical protein
MRLQDIDSGLPVTFSNSNSVSFGTNGDAITAAAFGSVAAGTQSAMGAGQAVVFSNSNNVTFGMSGSATVTASYSLSTAPQALAAGTQTATSGTVVFSTQGMSFGMAGSTVTALAAPTMAWWSNVNEGWGINGIFSTNESLVVAPLNVVAPIQGVMTISTMLIPTGAFALQTTSSGSFNFCFGLYTLNASTLSLLNSVSTQVTWAAVSNNSTAFSGWRWLSFHSSQWSTTPVVSQTDYWYAWVVQSSNATQNFQYPANPTGSLVNRQGTIGVNNSTGSSFLDRPFWGVLSATTAALPASIASNALSFNTGTLNYGSAMLPVVFNNLRQSF